MPRKSNHYINNKSFLEAIIAYKQKVQEAEQNDQPKPQIPNYIGECILKISTNVARRPNFSGYMFKDEMVSDGIENCLLYIDKFDPEKSQNPFGYFTQIIWYAFLRRLEKEKKYLYTKFKYTEKVNMDNATSDKQNVDVGSNFHDDIKQSDAAAEYEANFVRDFENTMKKKAEKRKKNNENLFGD